MTTYVFISEVNKTINNAFFEIVLAFVFILGIALYLIIIRCKMEIITGVKIQNIMVAIISDT